MWQSSTMQTRSSAANEHFSRHKIQSCRCHHRPWSRFTYAKSRTFSAITQHEFTYNRRVKHTRFNHLSIIYVFSVLQAASFISHYRVNGVRCRLIHKQFGAKSTASLPVDTVRKFKETSVMSKIKLGRSGSTSQCRWRRWEHRRHLLPSGVQ